MKNSNFNALVARIDTLKESEQGKLKGGICSLNPSTPEKGNIDNPYCAKNVFCGKTTQQD